MDYCMIVTHAAVWGWGAAALFVCLWLLEKFKSDESKYN